MFIAVNIRPAGRQASGDSPVSALPVMWELELQTDAWLYVGVGDLNAYPHTFIASILHTDTFPQS